MKSQELLQQLVNWTVRNSPHEDHRRYIGLSSIGECDRVIYDRFRFGAPGSASDKLLAALSYGLQDLLSNNLRLMGLFKPGKEIVLYNGLVQGHTDGEIAGDLLEIKTVGQEIWLPDGPRLPNKIFYQVQAYLKYGGYRHAHVVYLARDTGALRVIGVSANDAIARNIEAKISRLVQAVRTVERPPCRCGRCPAGTDPKTAVLTGDTALVAGLQEQP